MLGRFYAICNCCSCCCGAMQAHRNGTPMLASSGFVATVEIERCVGCSLCTDVCHAYPFHAAWRNLIFPAGLLQRARPSVTAAARNMALAMIALIGENPLMDIAKLRQHVKWVDIYERKFLP